MLFTYTHLHNHSIYKLQEWVDQIYLDIWCKADPLIDFDIDLFPPDIKEVVKEIYFSGKITDYLFGPIKSIYEIFQAIDTSGKKQLANWYIDGNNIEKLCTQDPNVSPFPIDKLNSIYPQLKLPLEMFYKSLWKSVIDLKAVKDKIGSIDNHYKEFVKINSKGKCPFCGLSDLDSEYVKTREAYDHYLPKSIYPFLSVNFNNLAPMCHKCNSGNKTTKDPILKNGSRRKTFYPYANDPVSIKIDLKIDTTDISAIEPENISLIFGPDTITDELKTWNDLFDIENRYKAKCCSSESKYWITQILEGCGDNTPSEFLKDVLKIAEKSPFADTNFLRKPFLEACNQKHFFDQDQSLVLPDNKNSSYTHENHSLLSICRSIISNLKH